MKNDHRKIGRRICIIGPSCAGKSTLSEKLAGKLNYPLLHLDQIAHSPGTNWVLRASEETRTLHDIFIEGNQWIVDGQYKSLMPQRLWRADTVILIKVNRFTCCWRFLKRCWTGKNRPGRLKNASGDFNWGRIWWMLHRQPKRWKEQMQIIAGFPHVKIIVLRSFKDLDSFLNDN